MRELKCGSLAGPKGTATLEGFHSNGGSWGKTEHHPSKTEVQRAGHQWGTSEEQMNGDHTRKKSGFLPSLTVTSYLRISACLPALPRLP